jgi:lactate racemase
MHATINPTVNLLYGKGDLPVLLPAGIKTEVILKPAMPLIADPVGAVAMALETPVEAPSLSEMARSARSACIVICDITRPVPNGVILPPLIRALIEAGLPAEHITVLIATGLHRPNLGPELEELVGEEWVTQTVEVVNHYAQNAKDHVTVGTTRRGTTVRLDRRFVEADLKIVTGLVEPHFMAGYSGGRKVIAPGIAHEDTIRTFHNTTFMENPLARNANLQNNPLHDEQVEIVGMLGRVLAINTVLDDKRRLSFVNFGEVLASHAEAVTHIRAYAEIPIARRHPLVITCSAGHPLDLTYYQTGKGMVSALGALAPGGTLLIASRCAEGLGSEEFRYAQKELIRLGVDGFLAEARKRPLANVDEWQTVKITEALRQGRIHLFSEGLDESARNLTGVTCHMDWTEALTCVVRESQAQTAAIIPEGPYVVPLAHS